MNAAQAHFTNHLLARSTLRQLARLDLAGAVVLSAGVLSSLGGLVPALSTATLIYCIVLVGLQLYLFRRLFLASRLTLDGDAAIARWAHRFRLFVPLYVGLSLCSVLAAYGMAVANAINLHTGDVISMAVATAVPVSLYLPRRYLLTNLRRKQAATLLNIEPSR